MGSVAHNPIPEPGEEQGSALVEAAFALAILLLVLAPVTTMLSNVFRVGGDARTRVVAAGIAASDLDATSAEPFSSIPLGRTVSTQVVGGVTFTIDQDVELVGIRSATGCASGAGQQILRVSASVTWREVVAPSPLVETTTVSPPVAAFNPATGSIAVTVLGATNQAQAGMTVSVTGPSSATEMTTADGCAFFDTLNPGSYTVRVTGSGDVSDQELASPTSPVQVVAGGTAGVQFAYDQAAVLNVAFTAAGGLPAGGVAIAAGNPHIQPSGWTSTVLGAGSTSPIYPFPSGYTLWAGDCEENDPQGVDSSGVALYPGAPSLTPVAVSPGGSSTVSVALPPITVSVTSSGTPVSGATLTAGADGSGCPSDTLTMTTTTGAGTSVTGMPYGHFAITATAGSKHGTVTVWIKPSGVVNASTGATISGAIPVPVE